MCNLIAIDCHHRVTDGKSLANLDRICRSAFSKRCVVRLYATFQQQRLGSISEPRVSREEDALCIVSWKLIEMPPFCLVKRSFRETKLLLPANFHRLDSLHLRAIFQSTNFHPRFPSRLKARNIARSIFFSDIRFFLKKEKKRKRD